MSTVTDSLNSRVAEELRALAARRGVEYRELAEAVGKNPKSIGRYLRGERDIDLNDLEAMCERLGADVVEVVRAARLGAVTAPLDA